MFTIYKLQATTIQCTPPQQPPLETQQRQSRNPMQAHDSHAGQPQSMMANTGQRQSTKANAGPRFDFFQCLLHHTDENLLPPGWVSKPTFYIYIFFLGHLNTHFARQTILTSLPVVFDTQPTATLVQQVYLSLLLPVTQLMSVGTTCPSLGRSS